MQAPKTYLGYSLKLNTLPSDITNLEGETESKTDYLSNTSTLTAMLSIYATTHRKVITGNPRAGHSCCLSLFPLNATSTSNSARLQVPQQTTNIGYTYTVSWGDTKKNYDIT